MKRVVGFWLLAVVAVAGVAHSAYAQQVGEDGKDRWVVVFNDRSSDMMRLYASRATTDDWEGNKLAAPIAAGAKRPINFDDGTGACIFDFRAIFRDNQMVHMWKINVCRESHWRVVD